MSNINIVVCAEKTEYKVAIKNKIKAKLTLFPVFSAFIFPFIIVIKLHILIV